MDSQPNHERDFLDAVFQEAVKNKASDKHTKAFFFKVNFFDTTPKGMERWKLRDIYEELAKRFERVGVLRIKSYPNNAPLIETPDLAVEIVPVEFIDFYNRRFGLMQAKNDDAVSRTFVEVEQDGLITNVSKKRSHKYRPHDKRFQLIRLLAERNDFVGLAETQKRVAYKNAATLSKEKRAINMLMLKKLALRDFIVNETNRGYRINPLYRTNAT